MSAPIEKKPFGSLKLQEWPECDRRLLEEAARPAAFLKPGGAASAWRPKTLDTVVYRYGVFLWWLRQSGRLPPGSTPIERLMPDNVKAFVAEYEVDHASTSVAVTLHGVYEAARVMHPNAELSYLLDAVGALKAMAKTQPKLPRMADPKALMGLGEALIEHGAKRARQGHMLSAVAVRDGCVILFQIACPLRRSNVEALQIGKSLLREDLGYSVAFGPGEMKNHKPFEATLANWLTPHLDYYIDVVRPVLLARGGQPDTGRLWLGAEGESMTGKALSRRLREVITQHLGRAMSIHLFRDVATTAIAVHDGAHIGIAGDILGHGSATTSEKHYNQAKGVAAARKHHALLVELRQLE